MAARNVSVGERIAILRRRHGWSQAVMAGRLGKSAQWLSYIERGQRSADRLSVLAPIAELLGVTVADLTDERPAAVVRDPEHECVRAVRLTLSAFGFAGMDASAHPLLDHDGLRERVRAAWDLTHEARYGELGHVLPELIPDCERSAWVARRAGDFRLVAELYHVVAATMAELGDADAAWVAADRAAVAAAHAGDAVLSAASSFRLGHAFLSAGRLEQAARTVEVAAQALLPAAWAGDPDATALWGALNLVKAITAARTADRGTALAAIGNAASAAGRLGDSYQDLRFDTEFGARNVALHAVAVAVELGDAAEALRHWGDVDVNGLSAERRARLLVDVARAHALRRRGDAAMRALEEAEQLAPEMIRFHWLARETVLGLLRRRRGRARADRTDLVARMGLL
jgi:transcriptional regulator with XRE-family HTH domain